MHVLSRTRRPLSWLCVFVGLVALRSGLTQTVASAPGASGWVLTWSDEFDGPNGSAPDATKWTAESGGSGWGNNELEYYTARSQNVRVENGNLVIEGIKEKFVGPDGVQRDYTSARLKTEGHFSQRYGRFEARIQVPSGQGAWPAFWMLGDNCAVKGWPACGEIDVMETAGSEADTIVGSLHGPGYAGASLAAAYRLPRGRFSDAFHTFAIEWEPQVVRFYVDDELYATRTPADVPDSNPWVYDHPFFLLLNLAVGGNFAGHPNASTIFPQRMLVDYVRVFARK